MCVLLSTLPRDFTYVLTVDEFDKFLANIDAVMLDWDGKSGRE